MTRKKSVILLIVFTYSVFFVGCDFNEQLKKQLEKYVPKKADKFARAYIDILLEGDVEHAEKLLGPNIVTSETHSNIKECANILNNGKLISIEIVGVNIFKTKEKTRNNLTYQLQFKDAWLLANVIVDDICGKQQIFGFHLNNIPKSLEEINAFTLLDKTFRHYIILLFAVGVPVFIIYTIILCIRTKMKKKWLWIIFMLIGIGKYSFNWSGGQMGFTPLAIQLFSAAAFKGGLYAPWIISVSVPIGALSFILKRHKIKKSELVDISKTLDSSNKITDKI